MTGNGIDRRLAVLALVCALGAATAGCIAQDRPHVEPFTVVADAGAAEVLQLGQTAHLDFPENRTAVSETGQPVHEHAEYQWTSSWGDHGDHEAFNATPPSAGLSIVELNITVKNHTASDAVGILTVPGGGTGTGTIYLGALGEAAIEQDAAGPAVTAVAVKAGAHTGGSYQAPIGGGSTARFRIVPHAAADAPEVVLVIAVKEGPGAVHENTTGPLALDAARNYTLIVDTTSAAQHRIEVKALDGTVLETLSLAEFEAAYAAEAEAQVEVAVPGQTLPGLEAVAAFGALSVVALARTARRH